MTPENMTAMERVLTALSHKEPDRVPFFLLVTLHGALELGISIKEYFSRPDYVAEGQLKLRNKYRHDCLYGFFYAPVEVEAWGGEVIFSDDGPPNSGEPFIRRSSDIDALRPPDVVDTPCLRKVLDAIALMKERSGNTVPIIGVVISPFSLPVMQMGFGPYLRLMHEQPGQFRKLMNMNTEFCVAWANAQFDAGAAAICYFDPVSSSTIIPREKYLETGFKIAGSTLSRFKGPSATHMASGRCLSIVEDIARTGTAAVGVSCDENISELKKLCKGKIGVIGNMNGIEMTRWTTEQTRSVVKNIIKKAAPEGGFILSDNHGEIPFQTPNHVLEAISETVRESGRYPLNPERE